MQLENAADKADEQTVKAGATLRLPKPTSPIPESNLGTDTGEKPPKRQAPGINPNASFGYQDKTQTITVMVNRYGSGYNPDSEHVGINRERVRLASHRLAHHDKGRIHGTTPEATG